MSKKIFLPILGLVLILLPHFIRNDYILLLFIYVCMYSILGMGFSIIWKNRLITCGQAGFWAVGAYTSALLTMKTGMARISRTVAGRA